MPFLTICIYLSAFLLNFYSSELNKMGVTLFGHQKKILASVQSLHAQGSHVQV